MKPPVPATAQRLSLSPHPEGGWYRRIYTAATSVELPDRGARPTATLIHYLLRPGERSAWHTVRSDELWLWQGGGPLRLITAEPGEGPDPTRTTTTVLGSSSDSAEGQSLHALVPARAWQSAEPASDQEVLLTCLVTPGFDFADLTFASEDAAGHAASLAADL
ncbi:cupin domain-containing protein [Nocardia fluminea]|uniref:DUF985 domain-containing protein n=1 Tax=Nocardia fluminea TaxID=134984 RepID=A0A2N3VA14_9NOCA|nr:cupin domain-containing protein [Nocardia fluminea]PKV78460.1 hypothetical protein ATK86_2832 [Nocardia fluminea]